MAHPLGDFRAGNKAVQIQELGADLLHEVRAGLQVEQLIVQSVASAHDFNVVHEVAVDGRQADAAVVHLPCEHLITVEPVSEDAAVTIW